MSSFQIGGRRAITLAVTVGITAAGLILGMIDAAVAQGPPSSRSGFSPDEMISRMDLNQNGQIEPDEFQNSRARYFLEGRLRDAGIDTSKPMSVNRIKETMTRARESGGGPSGGPSYGGSSSSGSSYRGSSSSGSSSSSSSSSRDSDRDREREREKQRTANKTPSNPFAFGVPDPYPPLGGFGDVTVGPSLEALAKKYDREIMKRVEEALERYDKNGDGVLEQDEYRNSRLSEAEKSDTNKDGRLTRLELAERYVAREKAEAAERAEKSSRSSSSSASGGGGGPGPGGPIFFGGPGGFPGGSGGGFPGGGFGGGFRGDWGSRDSGSRDSSSRGDWGSRDSGSRDGGSSSSSDRMAGFAEGMIKQFDSNKDGKLQKDEWSKMPNDPQSSDSNKDGIITKEEMIERLTAFTRSRSGGSPGGGPAGGSSSTNSKTASSTSTQKSYRFLTPAERLPKELPSWFISSDKNADGQVAMAEYASTWSDDKVARFVSYDANGDGVITAKECLKVEAAKSEGSSSLSR